MNKRFNFRRARGAVALALVAFVVAGLLFRIGSGTPSAFGIDQIAAVCPLGALEALFGAKEFMLHPIILLAAMVVLVVVFGKAFCAWGCPVPWLQRFFRPKKKASGEKTSVGGQKSELGGASPACSSCDGACKLAPLGGARRHARVGCRVRIPRVLPGVPRRPDVRDAYRPLAPVPAQRAVVGARRLPDYPCLRAHGAAEVVLEDMPDQRAHLAYREREPHAASACRPIEVLARRGNRLPFVRRRVPRKARPPFRAHSRMLEVRSVHRGVSGEGDQDKALEVAAARLRRSTRRRDAINLPI